ncbi:hypothetical protein Clacol_003869 [Clathrus columnatus]|uniref:Phosphoglycerate mutase-like protein n=1 Tax=Clathrus columnatus TaxID=1419009 RepID=A0AAV5A5T3_9AGAM|nr:hypothetical protein Clacol_003869 [Clathrus columnatus]
MLETIYIARHGFRQNWVNDFWKSPTDTPRDPPLASYGEKQAKELANYIASLPEDEKPTAIFSSPFYRCIQTAAPIAQSLDKPLYIENGLSEWFSPVVPGTGLHPKPPAAPVLSSLFPSYNIDPEIQWSPTYIPTRLGETITQLHERCREFLRAFIPRVGGELKVRNHDQVVPSGHRHVLLITHAATAIALTRALVGDDTLSMRVACCSLTILKKLKTGNGSSWDIIQLAQGDFLVGGLERDWGFEDVVLNGNEVILDKGEPGTENDVQQKVGPQNILPHSKI